MSALLRHATQVAPACERKNRFSSEARARVYAQRAIVTNRNTERLYVYACANCRGWHLTKDRNALPAVTAAALREGLA